MAVDSLLVLKYFIGWSNSLDRALTVKYRPFKLGRYAFKRSMLAIYWKHNLKRVWAACVQRGRLHVFSHGKDGVNLFYIYHQRKHKIPIDVNSSSFLRVLSFMLKEGECDGGWRQVKKQKQPCRLNAIFSACILLSRLLKKRRAFANMNDLVFNFAKEAKRGLGV